TLVLRPIIEPIMTGFAGSMMGGVPTGPGMNATGTFGQANQMFNSFTGGISGSLASGIGWLGESVGSEMMQNFAAGMKGASLPAGVAGPTTQGASGSMGAGSWV